MSPVRSVTYVSGPDPGDSGAGDGNRTHVRSLGSFYTAIVRRPLNIPARPIIHKLREKSFAINSLYAGTLRPSGAAWSIMAPVSQRSSLLMSATPTTVDPRRPPGPRGIPLVGTSFMASRDSTQTLTRWARDYGDIVYYRFFDFHFYALFHPQHIEQVLLGKTGNFVKGITSRANPELFGNGLDRKSVV